MALKKLCEHRTVHVNVPKARLKQIGALVQANVYANQSDFIRTAIVELLFTEMKTKSRLRQVLEKLPEAEV
jgi:Arc/MetJ-type ribon-helix-helix transcriptional regulator